MDAPGLYRPRATHSESGLLESGSSALYQHFLMPTLRRHAPHQGLRASRGLVARQVKSLWSDSRADNARTRSNFRRLRTGIARGLVLAISRRNFSARFSIGQGAPPSSRSPFPSIFRTRLDAE